LEWVCLILLIIGGLNWGFVGVVTVDLLRAIFGTFLAHIIEIVICLAAVYMIYAILQWRKEGKEETTE